MNDLPQGNDTAYHEAFKSSVESQYGEYANAEDMIRSHQANIDPGVRRAGLSQVDPTATDKLREKGIDKVAAMFKDVPDGWLLEDFAVRGNAVSGVFFDEQGLPHKRVTALNDRFDPLAGVDRTEHARIQAENRVKAETARLRAEAEGRIAEARAAEEERIATEIAKIREKADADVAKATDETEKKKKSGSRSKSKQSMESRSGGAGASASRGAGGKAGTADDPAEGGGGGS